jgi:hypothetical protein
LALRVCELREGPRRSMALEKDSKLTHPEV